LTNDFRGISGTPLYIAPEVLNGQVYSYSIDIWALGIILYSLLFGEFPFHGENVQETYNKIRNLDYKFPNDHLIPKEAQDLIKSILQLCPGKITQCINQCVHLLK
jgi:serine/threonine protein kinase